MKRLIIAASAVLLWSSAAWAACPTSIPAKDATGTTQNLGTINDANGNCVSEVNAGDATQVAPTVTVQNAAYASGNCVGGFIPVTIANYNGESGFLISVRVSSVGGATPTLTAYVFDANPSASTCTDRSTFTLNSADIDKLVATPTSLTLAAPTGTTVTVGDLSFSPPRPFKAGGSAASGVKTIYVGLVSGSSFTPAATSDIHMRVTAALN